SERQVAREYGLARETVRKMLQYSIPPGYRRQQPAKRPKLDPWVGVIDVILKEDRERPRKQRHTAKRIHQRLGEEHGFSGGYTIVKDYVRLRVAFRLSLEVRAGDVVEQQVVVQIEQFAQPLLQEFLERFLVWQQSVQRS